MQAGIPSRNTLQIPGHRRLAPLFFFSVENVLALFSPSSFLFFLFFTRASDFEGELALGETQLSWLLQGSILESSPVCATKVAITPIALLNTLLDAACLPGRSDR